MLLVSSLTGLLPKKNDVTPKAVDSPQPLGSVLILPLGGGRRRDSSKPVQSVNRCLDAVSQCHRLSNTARGNNSESIEARALKRILGMKWNGAWLDERCPFKVWLYCTKRLHGSAALESTALFKVANACQ